MVGIEQFSWELAAAGSLGAFLLDLTRWAVRFQTDNTPRSWLKHLLACAILILVGGGVAGLFGAVVDSAVVAAALGAGGPGVIRSLANWGPKIVEGRIEDQLRPDFRKHGQIVREARTRHVDEGSHDLNVKLAASPRRAIKKVQEPTWLEAFSW